MTDEQKDLGTQGREASREGKRNQGNGWLRKVVGKVTGNREMQAKGAVQETGGKLQTQGGEVEQNVDQALKQGQADAHESENRSRCMITYVSKMFSTSREAQEQLSNYQALIEEAGGTVTIEAWERKEVDRTTHITETTKHGETTADIQKEAETMVQQGPVLLVILPEEKTLSTLLPRSEELAFKMLP